MNPILGKIKFEVGQIDAQMFAIESLYLDCEVVPEDEERAGRGLYAFYTLWDTIKQMSHDLDELGYDLEVEEITKRAKARRGKPPVRKMP